MHRSALLLVTCSFVLVYSTAWADMKPQGSDPVFRIYLSARGGGTGTSLYMETDQPLMVISSAANVQIAGNVVRLTMTRADASRFANITRQHANQMLILVGRGRALQGVQVTSPITDGVLEFRYPQEELAADYVKKRFGLR